MNGVHDMGGMHGFGKVEPEKDEPPFHAGWEGRVLAMQRAAPPNARRSAGRDSTSMTVAIFGANHMISVMTNSAMPASGRMKFAGP